MMMGSAVGGQSGVPVEGGLLPDIVLKVPQSPAHREYLGLAAKKTFKIPDIKSEIVIIEIFSMY
jgi:hypothetical protein